MKIEFKKPNVPNFIRTNIGLIDIKELEKQDLEELKIVFNNELEDNWRRRKFTSDRIKNGNE